MKLTAQDIWGDIDCLRLALKGNCPVILHPPYEDTSRCIRVELCPIFHQCRNNISKLSESAKREKGRFALDEILGLL